MNNKYTLLVSLPLHVLSIMRHLLVDSQDINCNVCYYFAVGVVSIAKLYSLSKVLYNQ
jgi:hypothetical protein